MSRRILRFGLHDFLNAQPLLIPLLNDAQKNGFQMEIDVPSRLAEALKSGTLDLAMIPTVEYLKGAAGYLLTPGVAIASRGRVGTVLLASKVPVEEIKTLALDNRSRTSVALLKILFGQKFRREVAFELSPPQPEAMLRRHDAALIIGDQSFSLPRFDEEMEVHDLSEEWFLKTGKTFVHAVLAVREGVVLERGFCHAIQSAKREGLKNIPSIVRNYAAKGLDSGVCEDYLRHKIIYDLGERELEGMTFFQQLCYERGVLPENHPVRFVEDE